MIKFQQIEAYTGYYYTQKTLFIYYLAYMFIYILMKKSYIIKNKNNNRRKFIWKYALSTATDINNVSKKYGT